MIKCKNNHSFDISKQGYCNLLLVDKKHSAAPGDNQLMVQSRFDFLSKGFYKKLSDCLCQQVDKHFDYAINILDAGCGYGYYCNNIYEYRNKTTHENDKISIMKEHAKNLDDKEIMEQSTNIKCIKICDGKESQQQYAKNEISKSYCDKISGVDISKFAISKASGINKKINYYVASVFDLPFKSKAFDCIISVFSPFAMKEYGRVLSSDGLLIAASPAPKHLWELKEILYGEFAEEKDKVNEWQSWTQVDKIRITYEIFLTNKQDIDNLFEMTPYYYTTSQEKKDRLNNVDEGRFTLDFFVTILKKN